MQLNAGKQSAFAWFYAILDIEHGIGLAVDDALACRYWPQAVFSLIVNVLLGVFLGLVWVRYDLISTGRIFLPVVGNVVQVLPTGGDTWATVAWVARLLLGVATTFLTTLIQAAYPRLARRHGAAMWALVGSIIFDLATDYPDVQADFPGYFKGLIDSSALAGAGWWFLAAVVLVGASFIWSEQRSLFILLAILCGLCLFVDPPAVWRWATIFIWTIFCSFVAQSLTMIHVAKCLALVAVARKLRSVG